MKKLNRVVWKVILLSLLVLRGVHAYAESETYKIGVILPLSGDAASIGEAFRNGIKFGLSNLSQQTRQKISFIFEDDQLLPKNSVSVFWKLVQRDKVDLVVNLFSGGGKALAPLADRAKVPLVSISSDPAVSAGRAFVTNFWTTPKLEAEALRREATKRAYKNLARIVAVQEGALAVKTELDRINFGTILLDEEVPLDLKEFRSFLLRVKSNPAIDAIVPVLLPEELGAFARQARKLGITLPLFGIETFEDAAAWKVARGALAGSWYVSVDVSTQFVEKYRKEYPNASLFTAPTAYDFVQLLGVALQKGVPGNQLLTFLRSVRDFKGGDGGLFV